MQMRYSSSWIITSFSLIALLGIGSRAEAVSARDVLSLIRNPKN